MENCLLLSEIKTRFQLNSNFPLVYPNKCLVPMNTEEQIRNKMSYFLLFVLCVPHLSNPVCPRLFFQIGSLSLCMCLG